MGRGDDQVDLRVRLARASVDYEDALRELRAVRKAIEGEGATPELQRRLHAAAERAAQVALLIAQLREMSET